MAKEINDHLLKSAWSALYVTYGLVPLLAGLDKFVKILADWSGYLSDTFNAIIPMNAEAFMYLVGVIEIIAGIIVFVKPKAGGYIVMLWLIAIALNLILAGYLDIAVRDLAMAMGAYSLAKLSQIRGK